jgi:hypothetical protein
MNTENPWTFDLRIRDRNLKQGLLDEPTLGKYLEALPDLEAQTQSFTLAQPALDEDDFEDEDDTADDVDDAEDDTEDAAKSTDDV